MCHPCPVRTTPSGTTPTAPTTPSGTTPSGTTPTGTTSTTDPRCGIEPVWGTTAPTAPFVVVDRAELCRGDALEVRWEVLEAMTASSFVAVGEAGGSAESWALSSVHAFASAGEHRFEHLPRSCALEVRVYEEGSVVVGASAPFAVDCDGPDARIWTDSASYAVGDPIQISWFDADGWPLDWLAVLPLGAADDGYVAFE
ncbi:MAG: hypothetical protein ACI8PZ_005685 [Myxococcota bacterium]|jgi:hypothetical protein